MSNDDIHDKEQRKNGPILEPGLTNKELKKYDFNNLGESIKMEPSNVDNTEKELNARGALYQRAWNFIHQHRPELTRELNQGGPSSGGGKKERHRGTVTDPEHDLRLKENKDDAEKNRDEKQNSILEDKDKAQKERKMQELEQIDKNVRHASSFVLKNPKPNVPKVHSQDELIQHKNKGISDYAKSLGGPSNWDANKTKAVNDKLQQHPKFGPILRGEVPGGNIGAPKPAQPKIPKAATQEENILRNDPYFGTMVCGILGNERINSNNLNKIREKLIKALDNSTDLKVKNAIQMGISLTANLLFNIGLPKDGK